MIDLDVTISTVRTQYKQTGAKGISSLVRNTEFLPGGGGIRFARNMPFGGFDEDSPQTKLELVNSNIP